MKLVYLSPVSWASFAQRPHRFVEWFQNTTQGSVLWIDPYPTRLPAWSDVIRRGAAPSASSPTTLPPRFDLLAPRALPVEPLPGSGLVNGFLWAEIRRVVRDLASSDDVVLGIGKPSELALQLLSLGGFTKTFYDAMDDFPEFYAGLSRISMARRERQVASKVTNVLVSSTALSLRWKNQANVSLARNACNVETLPAADLAKATGQAEILGYVGTMGAWFDWDLVLSIARARPDAKVRLVGPVFSSPPADLPPNIELLPPCEHSQALQIMQKFSVGLVPFKINRLTESVDPIKYYEYRALGLPVISSDFGEMRFHQKDRGVFVVGRAADASDAVDRALKYEATAEEVERFRVGNSWGARFSSIGLFN
jgi:glycosyltransferase involved in cell wall biosynthesis